VFWSPQPFEIAAIWIWKGLASESESKIESKQSEQLD
jgi:hypothetical protein